MGVAALGRQAAYGARPKESRKLRAAAACITEVADVHMEYRGMVFHIRQLQFNISLRSSELIERRAHDTEVRTRLTATKRASGNPEKITPTACDLIEAARMTCTHAGLGHGRVTI